MAPRVIVIQDVDSIHQDNIAECDYVLVSQERMTAKYLKALQGLGCDMLIIDEVHKLKNLTEGERSQNVLQLAESISAPDQHLVLLSGTPVPNKIRDVAVVLKLLYPDRFAGVRDKELITSLINGDIVDIRNLLIPRMQMKELRESVEMPQLVSEVVPTRLSATEEDIYEVLLEDDELTADQKIRSFRKFVMNPASLETTPDIEGSKIRDARHHLQKVFETKRKVVMFVNGYVDGMIKGENNILEQLQLPPDTLIRVIEGEVSKEDRVRIQRELEETDQKMLLAVSGGTADVGVDFSSADYVFFYNNPWTEYDKRQQTARVYRPGLQSDLTVATSVVQGTIEEGIGEYIKLKYEAIQKLLKGVPITDIEKEILRTAEKQKSSNIEGDAQLAKEWLNSPQNKLHRFFAVTKEIGETNFHKFLMEYGEEYAECYLDMGSRGFQANTGRVVGTLIERFVTEKKQNPSDLRILDIASGPEMLKTHISDALQPHVVSLDMNVSHFKSEGENRLAASFVNLPISARAVDYANISLALHYSRLIPRRGEYERLTVLAEMNRVLREGGRAVINLLYSIQFKDPGGFRKVAEAVGFKVVEEYTGDVSAGNHYQSHCTVLEKVRDTQGSLDELVAKIGKEHLDGLKFKPTGIQTLKNSRRILHAFNLHGTQTDIVLNNQDRELSHAERSILDEAETLKVRYGSIKGIPKEEIINGGFLRIYNGKTYRLFKKSELLGGFVDAR